MRLTKSNPETGQYEYIEKAKTLSEYRAQRKAAIQRLGEFEDRAEWISVEERLPDNDEAIIYAESGMGMINVNLLGMDWQRFIGRFNVTHWMPLPQPPKMKGAGDDSPTDT
jgi:hypothetical protein